MGSEPRTSPLHRLQPRRQWVTIGLAVAIVALLAWVVWDHTRSDRQAEVATEQATEANEQAELSAANAQIIAEQIIAACEEQGEIADALGRVCQQAEQVAEEPAQPVARPPSDEQVDAAVQRYCGEVGCAQGPTAADVAAAVERYCDARGECRGEPGEDGEDGEDAPPLSDEQLAAAVASYCGARNECRGADGVDGRDGVDGVDGEPPMGWTTTRCDVLGRCITETCERSDPFDEQRPIYTCSEVPG